jgi:hypothetical protein
MLALALGLAGDENQESGQALGAVAPPESSEAGGSSVQPATPPVSGGGPLTLNEEGEPVPYWKAKQDAARKAQEEAEAAQAAEAAAAGQSGQPQDPGAPTTEPTSPATTKPLVATTREVGVNGSTPLVGVWAGAAHELSDYLLATNPNPRFTVPPLQLAEYYVRYGAEVKLRADVLWAQMLHETGFGKYGGDVSPEQNNYAGIGATGGGAPGVTFPTAELGAQAHIAHLVAYVYPTDMASWTNASVDPRYDKVQPRGTARVLSDLDGRWAVPGLGYGARIENHVRALNP